MGVRASGRSEHWPGSKARIVPQLVWGSGLGAAFTKDTPTEVFSRVGENFIRWLRGEIVWDASTSPVVLAAAEPGAAPDRGRITISRDNKLLQRPRQVSFGVRP